MIFTTKRGRRLLAIVAAAAAPLLVSTAVASQAQASTAGVTRASQPAFAGIGQVIYDSTSPNVTASEGFQCCAVSEFGDAVGFTPLSGRHLTQVTVEMDDWAVFSNPSTIPDGFTGATTWKGQATGAWPGGGTNPNGATYSNPRGWYWPLTLNLYAPSTSSLSGINKPGTYPAAGALIASVTQTVLIPWQPTPSTSRQCLKTDQEDFGSNLQAYETPSGCEFGYPADVTFDLPDGGMSVPNGLVWGVAFDTETYGSSPVGYAGPFVSLNVALTQSVRVGKDANPGGAFLDSTEAGEYESCYTGPNSTGSVIGGCPTGNFRNDPNGWTGYVPAARFTASIPIRFPFSPLSAGHSRDPVTRGSAEGPGSRENPPRARAFSLGTG